MNQGASDIKFIELKDTIDRLSKVIDRQNSMLESLERTIHEKESREAELLQTIRNLEAQLAYMKQKQFGASSERKDLISVFLSGNLEARIKEIQAEQNLSAEEAKEFVEHVDDCRVAYHKYYTDLTWGNADDYDICLDCDRLGAEQTAAMIEHYVKEVGSKTE